MQTRISPTIEVAKPATRFKVTKFSIWSVLAGLILYCVFMLSDLRTALMAFVHNSQYPGYSVYINWFGEARGNQAYINMIQTKSGLGNYIVAAYLILIAFLIIEAITLNKLIAYICLAVVGVIAVLSFINLGIIYSVTIQPSATAVISLDLSFGFDLVLQNTIGELLLMAIIIWMVHKFQKPQGE
jgi:hypothetical protein